MLNHGLAVYFLLSQEPEVAELLHLQKITTLKESQYLRRVLGIL